MATYTYRALTESGDVVSGEMERQDTTAVIALLLGQALLPIQAIEKRVSAGFMVKLSLGQSRGFPPGELALFIHRLTRLLNANVKLDHALGILTGLTENQRAKQLVGQLLGRVRDGSSLAEAMAARSTAYPTLCINMARAGEEGGALPPMLACLGRLLVWSEAIRQKVAFSLIRPAALLLTACGSIVLILALVPWHFGPLLRNTGDRLPATAGLVTGASQSLPEHWWVYLLAVVLFVGTARALARMPAALVLRDRTALRLPLMRRVVTQLEVSRFTRSVSVLLANSVPAALSLRLAGATLANLAFVQAIETMASRFDEGEGLAQSLERTGCFPNLAIQLIRIGEETGRLEHMLEEVADSYERDLERIVERLRALLVPAITIFMGIVLALIIAAMLITMASIR